MKPGAPFATAFNLTAGAGGTDVFAGVGAGVDGDAGALVGEAGEAFGKALAAAGALPEAVDGLALAGTGQPVVTPFEGKPAAARALGPKFAMTAPPKAPATTVATKSSAPAPVATAPVATAIVATATAIAATVPATADIATADPATPAIATADTALFVAPTMAKVPTTTIAKTLTVETTPGSPAAVTSPAAAVSEGPAEAIAARLVVGGDELISLLAEERGTVSQPQTAPTGFPSARARQIIAGLRANDAAVLATPAMTTATIPTPAPPAVTPPGTPVVITPVVTPTEVATPAATAETAPADRKASAENQQPPVVATLVLPHPRTITTAFETAAAFDAPVGPAESDAGDDEPPSPAAAPLGATIARPTPAVVTVDPSAVAATVDAAATADGPPASDELVSGKTAVAFVGLSPAPSAATVLAGAAPRAARADANQSSTPTTATSSSPQTAAEPPVRPLSRAASSVRAFSAQAAQASPLNPNGSVPAPGAPALPSIEQIGTLAKADKGAFEDLNASLSERRPSFARTPAARPAGGSSAIASAPGKVDPATSDAAATDDAPSVTDAPTFKTDGSAAPAPGLAQTNAASALAGAPAAAALSAGPAAATFVAPSRSSGRAGIPGADLPTQLAGRSEATVAHATLAAAAAHGFVALAAHAALNARTLSTSWHASHGLQGAGAGSPGQHGTRGAHGGQKPLPGAASDPTAVRPLEGKGPLPAEAATLLPVPEGVAPRPTTADSNSAAMGAGAQLAAQGQGGPSSSTLSALFDLPSVPVAANAFLAQAAEDPSLRGTVMSDSASVSLDAGAAGEITLHLRVKDGVADVRVDGSAAPTLDLRSQDLRVALASEGLTLGGFETGQRASDQQAEFDRQDAGRTTSGEPARAGTTTASSTTRSHQPAVTLGGRLHVTA